MRSSISFNWEFDPVQEEWFDQCIKESCEPRLLHDFMGKITLCFAVFLAALSEPPTSRSKTAYRNDGWNACNKQPQNTQGSASSVKPFNIVPYSFPDQPFPLKKDYGGFKKVDNRRPVPSRFQPVEEAEVTKPEVA